MVWWLKPVLTRFFTFYQVTGTSQVQAADLKQDMLVALMELSVKIKMGKMAQNTNIFSICNEYIMLSVLLCCLQCIAVQDWHLIYIKITKDNHYFYTFYGDCAWNEH